MSLLLKPFIQYSSNDNWHAFIEHEFILKHDINQI